MVGLDDAGDVLEERLDRHLPPFKSTHLIAQIIPRASASSRVSLRQATVSGAPACPR
jgi:hypothetical protein